LFSRQIIIQNDSVLNEFALVLDTGRCRRLRRLAAPPIKKQVHAFLRTVRLLFFWRRNPVTDGGWRIDLEVPSVLASAVFDGMEAIATSVAASEITEGGDWRITGYTAGRPDGTPLIAHLSALELAHGTPLPAPVFAPIPTTDWLLETQAAFQPFRVGRFEIRPSHATTPVPAAAVPLVIDASVAFGTGDHASTRGCLFAITRIAKRRRYRRVLDMGCGTGILAFGALRLQPARAQGVDIDARSVRVARKNARINRLGARSHFIVSPGYAGRAVGRGPRYDLILANILARPLCRMSADLAAHLAPGGSAVLAGLLWRQRAMVIAAHRRQGLALVRAVRNGSWCSLELKRRG
jgi:ribosomal protein L11 methyltransferase